jgi:hypothetical protein
VSCGADGALLWLRNTGAVGTATFSSVTQITTRTLATGRTALSFQQDRVDFAVGPMTASGSQSIIAAFLGGITNSATIVFLENTGTGGSLWVVRLVSMLARLHHIPFRTECHHAPKLPIKWPSAFVLRHIASDFGGKGPTLGP